MCRRVIHSSDQSNSLEPVHNITHEASAYLSLSFWACACAAPTNLVSKTDAVGMYPASQSNFTVSPPLKYKIVTYTVSGANSVATLTCAYFPLSSAVALWTFA